MDKQAVGRPFSEAFPLLRPLPPPRRLCPPLARGRRPAGPSAGPGGRGRPLFLLVGGAEGGGGQEGEGRGRGRIVGRRGCGEGQEALEAGREGLVLPLAPRLLSHGVGGVEGMDVAVGAGQHHGCARRRQGARALSGRDLKRRCVEKGRGEGS